MRKYFFLFLLFFSSLHLNALVLRDGGELEAKRNVVADSYNFWVYTPENYSNEGAPVPLIIFLHGASLCGNNMNRVRRYGVLDAIQRGTSVPA
ncbi:MAG: phospholipase, partial [Prevotella sp.]|nr:phospholipase [Prevotella sp.]